MYLMSLGLYIIIQRVCEIVKIINKTYSGGKMCSSYVVPHAEIRFTNRFISEIDRIPDRNFPPTGMTIVPHDTLMVCY